MTEGTHLITFHIGPVQDFIASARRTRDLWFGSWVLSELSKEAAVEVVRQNGDSVDCLIFPAPATLEELKAQDFSVPNKVVARVNRQPADVACAVEKVVAKRLDEIREAAFQKVKGDFDRTRANTQVADLPEFHWASCPVKNGNYATARKQAEALLAARKDTREFEAVAWGDDCPKSSLDGQRESVIPENAYDNLSPEQLRRQYGVRQGERLCGVGLLKRHGERGNDPRFFSTSHVAALPLLRALRVRPAEAQDGHLKQATATYLAALRTAGIDESDLNTVPVEHPVFGRNDGHLLFEERLTDYLDDDAKLEEAKRALRQFLKDAFKGEKPKPYYAILHADGDRMGQAINEQTTSKAHRELSQQLSLFAGKVKQIVEGHNGSLVYAGGDDVLAFVPLHTVLQCARELGEAFRAALAGFTFEDHGETVSPTLSVGVAVAHHLEPLADALTLARQAEKAAKAVKGKNALAVTVSKRSGANCTVAGNWGDIDKRLDQFIWLHRDDRIPDGAAYQLRGLAVRLDVANDSPVQADLLDVERREAVRILKRKRSQRGKEELDEQVSARLKALVRGGKLSVEQLANELIVARVFAEATEQADIAPDCLPGNPDNNPWSKEEGA